jgi:hypothetical protein
MKTYVDYRYSYIVNHETWYAPLSDPVVYGQVQKRIVISRDHNGGGCAWEFGVNAVDLGGREALRVEMFGDSWLAFADVPEFFIAMADMADASLTDVRGLLDSLGFADRTERTKVVSR